MSDLSLFKWRHFQADIILCAVRWYLRYALSYRDVEELMPTFESHPRELMIFE
jgi:transposase, IS6 family